MPLKLAMYLKKCNYAYICIIDFEICYDTDTCLQNEPVKHVESTRENILPPPCHWIEIPQLQPAETVAHVVKQICIKQTNE